jgi:predicted nucleic acid-binding protein
VPRRLAFDSDVLIYAATAADTAADGGGPPHADALRDALLATQLAAAYRLKAPDALHLACAVHAGADAFVTNNRRDFRQAEILESPVVYPEGVGEG